MLLLLLACNGDPAPPTETDTDPVQALAQVDVIVIGSGPSGLAAAWEAQNAGAEVLILEMDDELGGGANYASSFLAIDSEWQASQGIEDSVSEMLVEWPQLTGASPDARVEAFLEGAASTLAWLEERGAEVGEVRTHVGAGEAARVHELTGPQGQLASGLIAEVEGLAWTEMRADRLVVEDGRVSGVEVWNLDTDEGGLVQADAVIVATGGFARDLQRLVTGWPEVERANVVVETRPGVDGLGHPLLEEVGAAWQNNGRYGLYAHTIADPRAGYEGEALALPALTHSLIVNAAGERIGNEQQVHGFRFADSVLEGWRPRAYALIPKAELERQGAQVPPYNLSEGESDSLSASDLEALGVAVYADSAVGAIQAWGIDPRGLTRTVKRYNTLATTPDGDVDFGKDAEAMLPFPNGAAWSVEVALGAAKSFSGAEVDAQARVLDPSGEPIPGLFAAGEVVGFLGTDAVGSGFEGSVTACYWLGRIAGTSAAE